MSGSRIAKATVVLGAFALVLAGFASSASASGSSSASKSSTSKAPFTILDITSTTGALASTGAAQTASLRGGVAYLNSQGGILGHHISLVVDNDNSDPTTAVGDLLSYLSAHGKPTYLIPGAEATITYALVPVAKAHGILTISLATIPGVLNKGKENPDLFGISPSAALQMTSLAAYLKAHNYKTVGILGEEIAFVSQELGSLDSELAADGITITSTQDFPATAINVTPEMSALQAQHPQALVIAGIDAPVGYALVARRELGWNVPVVGEAAFGATNFPSLVPLSDLKGVSALVYPCVEYVAPSKRSLGLKEMLKGLADQHVPVNQELLDYSNTWDSLMIVRHAALQAGSLNEAALVTALDHLKTSTDPLYVTFPAGESYTVGDHNDVAKAAQSFPFIHEGPLVDGMIKPVS